MECVQISVISTIRDRDRGSAGVQADFLTQCLSQEIAGSWLSMGLMDTKNWFQAPQNSVRLCAFFWFFSTAFVVIFSEKLV